MPSGPELGGRTLQYLGGGRGATKDTGAMPPLPPKGQPWVEGVRPGPTEEPTMPLHLHTRSIRPRRGAAAAAAGLILASASVAYASAAGATQASVARPTQQAALHA